MSTEGIGPVEFIKKHKCRCKPMDKLKVEKTVIMGIHSALGKLKATRPEFKAGVKDMATVEWLEYTIKLVIKDLEFLFLKG